MRRQAKGSLHNLVDSAYYTPRNKIDSKDSRIKRSIKSALRNSTTNLEDFDASSSENRIRFSAFIGEDS